MRSIFFTLLFLNLLVGISKAQDWSTLDTKWQTIQSRLESSISTAVGLTGLAELAISDLNDRFDIAKTNRPDCVDEIADAEAALLALLPELAEAQADSQLVYDDLVDTRDGLMCSYSATIFQHLAEGGSGTAQEITQWEAMNTALDGIASFLDIADVTMISIQANWLVPLNALITTAEQKVEALEEC